MKLLMLLVLALSLVSAALLARDLTSVAKREKQRRALVSRDRVVPSFDDADLERYRGRAEGPGGDVQTRRRRSPFGKRKDRDLEKEERYWRQEAARHERELARLDASIRRLEWRLSNWRRRRPRPGERIFDDPTSEMLEDSLGALREQKRRTEERFLERARKAGAFPGWLR